MARYSYYRADQGDVLLDSNEVSYLAGVFVLVYRKQEKVIEKACKSSFVFVRLRVLIRGGSEHNTGSILAIIKDLHVEREAIIHGMTYLPHSLFVGVPALQEATVAPNDLLSGVQPADRNLLQAFVTSEYSRVGAIRQFFKLIVDEDDGTVRQPVVANNHGLLDVAEVGVLSQDLFLHCPRWEGRGGRGERGLSGGGRTPPPRRRGRRRRRRSNTLTLGHGIFGEFALEPRDLCLLRTVVKLGVGLGSILLHICRGVGGGD